MKKFFRREYLAQFKAKYKKVIGAIAVIVVFVTTYALILPALTLDSNAANQTPGINTEQSGSVDDNTTSTSLSTENSDSQAVSETNVSSQDEQLVTTDTTLIADDKNYQVTADITAEAKLPESVALEVNQVKPEDDTYQSKLQKIQDTLSLNTVANIRLYDIAFMQGDAEVEPSASVKVTITQKDSFEANKDNLKVVHIKTDGSTEVLDAEVAGDGNQVTTVTFNSDSFSDFALVDTSTSDDSILNSNGSSTGTDVDASVESTTETETTSQSYTVTFYNDDSEITSTQIEAGTALTILPETPFKSGYRFDHWENAETHETVTADTIVTSDLTVKAVFTEISIYTVTVNYYYHNNSANQDVTFDKEIFQLEERDTPYPITPPTSTEVKREEDSTLTADAIYYPQEAVIELKSGDLAIKDELDGNIDGKVTINLQYVPYTAEYTVHYMLKNLTGDDYTEIQSVINHGVLGSTVSPQVLSYDYAIFEKTEATKLTQSQGQNLYVYYTRNSYTLSYNTNGGSHIPYQTGLYESKVSLTDNVPTKTGYTFVGWHEKEDLSDTAKTSGTITLDSDKTLYAEWKANTVNYTINYYKEVYNNATGTTSYVYDSAVSASGKVGTTVQADEAPALTTVPTGYERESAYGMNANSNVTIAADGTSVLKVYYSLVRYTFVFNLNGPYYYTNGFSTGRISKNGSDYYNSNYTIQNVVLGQDISSQWPSGDDVTDTYNYYSFVGWSSNTTTVLFVTRRHEVTEDMILGADSSNRKTYTANWQTGLITKQVDYYLQSANDPNVYELSSKYSQFYNSQANTMLNPKNIAGFTITETPSGYSNSTGYYYGSTYVVDHYRFYYTRNTYSIDYYNGSNINTISSIPFEQNINSSTYNYTPERPSGIDADYTWGGWYTDAGLTVPYTFDTMPSHNLVLYAKWVAPTFNVTFDLNGGDGVAPTTQEVEKYKTATSVADPSRQYYNFDGWYTAKEGGERYDWSQPVTSDTKLYAHWSLKPLTYTVRYLDADNNNNQLAADKTVTSPALNYQQVVSESALAITGYRPDVNSKSVVLDYDADNNIITFYYTKKSAQVSYRVDYVLQDNPTVKVAESKSVTVDGSTISVKESAVTVDKDYLAKQLDMTPEQLDDYYALTDVESLTLTSSSDNNVITFYYVPYDTAHITVNYLDMDGNPIVGQEPLNTTRKKPSQYTVTHKTISGYTYAQSEDSNGDKNKVNYKIDKGDNITINLYYQKDLYIEAVSKEKNYDGIALENSGLTDLKDSYKDLLETDDSLTGISFTGSQIDAGSSAVTPSIALVSSSTGKARNYYYNIIYVAGTLTVNKQPVTVIVNGQDKEKTYDGVAESISYDDLVINDSSGLYKESDIRFTGDKTFSATDAGTYNLTLQGKFTNSNANFEVTFQVSDGRLLIKPRPVILTSETAEKGYDGMALTAQTVTASEPTADTGFVTGEGLLYDVTGSQTATGSSDNTFTYAAMNTATKLSNYDIATVYGRLTVTPTVNIQKTKTNWTALTGGKFEISKWNGNTWTSIDGVSDLIITSTDGVTIPVGLNTGCYRITETAAPDGYVILDNSVYFAVTESQAENGQSSFAISLTDENGNTISNLENVKVLEGNSSYSTRIQIANETGKALPHTGGSGRMFYMLVGLALMLVTLAYRQYQKHRERSDLP
ncbi:InlB B-repeat-containing protein [Streptococcus gallolyticus subsp. gallolyticus]|uniref:InlB B-repeat-containing protein n=1 Tax=Streptococcus gallolyticus TaxID=315405 RepID=UPI0020009823|nr:InlB B-repeat-containing protein [Streptococcus gallolyticus]MCY7156755.1 InlB B-repeat-containing protein [Streptococcus gallolyticus subsp. gallolyticus]MCY7173098.1 InlB B-repeat-containing protein [Streptococcus gallolyticus subsp. gallolyticus]MCY7175221.1 InlB B-repeat-containing protein [Streptococcus gallolyticus subsp. gallolyticus]MCY7179676.1 InlB B-repeat-containing protein [Streptococcus gallolyticus subsp. gallolyticus]MCY7197227.1 InlB B-repeat-containing protein [Streptococc